MKKIIACLIFCGCFNAQCAVKNIEAEKFHYVPDLPEGPTGKHQEDKHPLDVQKNSAIKWKLDHDVETYHFREENASSEVVREGGEIRW